MALNTKTVQNLIDEIILMVQEDSSFTSGFWTQVEVIDYINEVEKEFFQRTAAIKVQNDVAGGSGDRIISEPADSMDIDRITFDDIPLFRTDRWQLDVEDRNWANKTGKPRKYHQDLLATKKFELDREIVTAGTLGVTSTKLPTELTAVGNTLNTPDSFFHYIKYGVLHKMLDKEGDGQDLMRAEYCHMRFKAGIRIVRSLMRSQGLISAIFNAA